MPIPLHLTRLRQRGFNQALLLANELAKTFAITLCFDNLLRIRATKPQVQLTGAERIRNVSGAFAVIRPGDISGKSILLIDDVFTTGATINECSLVLKRAGADRVSALTASRAL
jgi:ComF family protein